MLEYGHGDYEGAAKNAYNKARRMGMKQGKSWENNNNTKSAEAEIPAVWRC